MIYMNPSITSNHLIGWFMLISYKIWFDSLNGNWNSQLFKTIPLLFNCGIKLEFKVINLVNSQHPFIKICLLHLSFVKLWFSYFVQHHIIVVEMCKRFFVQAYVAEYCVMRKEAAIEDVVACLRET